jgi:monothiol glutaredoxin
MSGINEFIDNEIKTNDVVLFMKGTPQFPQCGFSGQIVQILDYIGVDYKGINVLADSEIRQGIKDYSNWPTIPQLYVKGEFIGGCDIVREMFQAGELQQHLQENGVTVRGAAGPDRSPGVRPVSKSVFRVRGAVLNSALACLWEFHCDRFFTSRARGQTAHGQR